MPPVPQVAQQISQEQSQQQNGPNLSSLHSSLPAPHSRNTAFLQQVQPAGCVKKHVLSVPTPVPVQQQLILSVARHHEDMILHKEKCKKREEKQLRTVAAFTAREIEHFWSTIKQVVDLKLQVELEERRKKVLNSQNISEKEIRDCLNKKESLQKEVVLPELLTSTVKKYTRDLADTAAVAEALLPKGSAQITTVVKSDAPSLWCGTLGEYQKTGLEWLGKLYKMNLSGILADEAGLGKTVQVFFAHLACNEGNWGPILVSRNFNVLKWEIELKYWCPALKILLYLGNPGELFKKSHHHLLLMDTLLPTALKDLWAMARFLIPGISQSYLDFTKGAIEEKRQLKEHLDRIHFGNERRCSRPPLYGRDLLEICSWIGERKISQHCSARTNKWCWAGFANCLPYSSTSEVLKNPLQELILTVKQQGIALKDVVTRQDGSSGCLASEAESKRTSCVGFDADDSSA
ncbi:E1A-binding protein p400-like isoform X2 [Aptenodytes patagonicus]|uniref:E1A-binding protein p400-like isoform X2 n=1 Tax=Aptenodytes patagonicus TaxID=9234 RepID=UPI003FA0420B